MKKFSLKKITAAVSAAAMIATMGTSAFADIDSNKSQNGTGISLKSDVSVIQAKDSENNYITGVYDVTVSFTTEQQQEIGVTLFAYAPQTQNPAPTLGTGYADQTTTPIVGVDQKEMTGTEGSITFRVSTNDSASIKMAEGQIGIVKVSGDKVDSPAVALFSIPESPWAITGVAASKSDTPVTEVTGINYNATVEEIAAAIKNAIDKVTVTGANEKTADWTVPETLSGVTVADYTPGKAGTFTAKVPLAQFRPSDAAATIGDVNELTFAVTVNKDIWTATSAQMADGGNYEKQLSDVANDAVLENDIKTKKIKLIAEGKELTLDYNDTFIITKGEDSRVDGVGVVKYSVKVPAGTYSDANNEVTVPEAGLTADVEYEVKEVIDYSKIVNATFTISNGSEVLTAPYGITVANKTTKDDAVKNITFALKNMAETPVDLVKDADYEVAWNGTYDAETAATYELTATITLKGEYKFEGGAATKEVKVSVTVQAAPAYKYGDVDGSGDITGNDVIEINKYIANESAGRAEYVFRDSDGNAIPNTVANVDGDEGITDNDVIEVNKYIANEAAGRPEYVFPVEKP